MNFTEWQDKVLANYQYYLEKNDGENHFIHKTYTISDPNKNGLTFCIHLNENGQPSAFTSDHFDFQWFNIAEGASSDDILQAASNCLSGNLRFVAGKIGKLSLDFEFTDFKTRGKYLSKEKDLPKLTEKYKLGYIKK